MFSTGARGLLMAGAATAAFITTGTGVAQAQTTTPGPAGTAAGTTITNTAQASYTVNGNAQTAQSNTATFVVDRKVNLTVINTSSANTSVNLGQAGVVTTFQVTNNTNGTQDFLLSTSQLVPLGLLTGTDNFDLANLKIVVDNGDGVYNPATDVATFIDELPADQSRLVFVVGDIPASGTPTPTMATVGLDVTVAAGGAQGTQGTALIPTPLNTINQDAEVDVVFADNDNDGTLGFDIARNGQAWAYGAYQVTVTNVALTVSKTATVLTDPVNLIANPKALPGATVQYCLVANNSTVGTAASDVALTDVIPANTTYVANSLTIGGLAVGGACVLNGFQQNDDGTQATGPYQGAFNAVTKTVTARIPTLAGGTAVAAAFRVTIN
ncbi:MULTISPECIES: hypothetical protein [unclassified Sphingomonas]|uniref:hypothetical protein n=2 Tax=Sphingomonas TaxID=13687 RepID=UPI00226A0A9C|nr:MULTISPECIES: hypothetical protein [unclassified Sphingomonas]